MTPEAGPMSGSAAMPVRNGGREVEAAKRAVFVAFIGSGFAFASWASRIPQVRDSLHLAPGRLGLLLLCIALGSLIALPLAGTVVTRFGAAGAITAMVVVLSVGLAVIAVGDGIGVVPVAAGLFLLGFGNGAWDVAMNVEGAAVERLLGRSIMPRFHAGWSFGTVAGALLGAAMVALDVPVTAHLLVVALVEVTVIPLAVRDFLPVEAPEPAHAPRAENALRSWLEPRTLLIGLFVLTAAFTEGVGNDWLGVAMIDGYHVRPAYGALTLAVFLAAMTSARWFGATLLDRFGRVPVLRVATLVALTGLLLVSFGGVFGVALVGVVLLGVGAALGFPVGMSAAADDPGRSAARVSVVASIGYVAFVAGPPAIGLLGDHLGVLHALAAGVALLVLGFLIVGACRPLLPGPLDAADARVAAPAQRP